MIRYSFLDHQRESSQADASYRCTCRSHADCLGYTLCALESKARFPFSFVVFDERCAARKDGGKCQKQPSDFRAELLCNDSRGCSNKSAEQKPQSVFVPLGLPDNIKFNVDFHRRTIAGRRTIVRRLLRTTRELTKQLRGELSICNASLPN